MPFYAVKKGHTPGIYFNWNDCHNQVNGYKGALYKKFNDLEDANAYYNFEVLQKDLNKDLYPCDYYVYTDGSCINNGQSTASAGIGIYFGPNDSRNVSRKIQGKQTNNVAELTAIIELYSILKEDIANGLSIGIVTDSDYAIKCATTYGKKCEQDNWSKEIPNKELVKQLYELYQPHSNVTFLHVEAHTSKTDPHSIGNREADLLARNA